MKRIILVLLIFFNVLPCIKKGEIKLIAAGEVQAQDEQPGSETDKGSWSCVAGDAISTGTGCTYTVICSCTTKKM